MSWLMDGSSKQRCCCFKQRRERFLLFPSPLVFLFFLSSFVFQWFIPLYSRFIFLLNSLPCFKLPRNLSFLSLFRFLSFLFSLSSCSFGPFPFRFFSSCVLVLRAIFIRQRGAGASLSLCVGSGANLPCHGAGLGNQWAWVCRARPCWFLIIRGRAWGFGFGRSMRGERGRKN